MGPIVLYYSDFFTRVEDIADTVDSLLHGDFHLNRTFVMTMIKDLAPTSMDVDADIVFIQTLGVDLKGLDTATFLEIADFIMDEIGVPK